MNNTDKFIQEGLDQIDNEVKQEDEIKDKAKYLAQLLTVTPVVKVEHNGSVFQLAMREHTTRKARNIVLVAVNEKTRQRSRLMNKPYIPATYTGEYNPEFTEKENYIAVIEAFLYHVIGEIKIDKEDDGIAKIAREKDFK